MKARKSRGLRLTGIFFIVFGVYYIGNAMSLDHGACDSKVKLVDDAIGKTIVMGKEFKEYYQNDQALIDSGRLEEFNKEYENYYGRLLKLVDQYKKDKPGRDKVICVIGLWSGFLSLIAGIALIKRRSWARRAAFISLGGMSLWPVLIGWATYPLCYIIQFIDTSSQKLNLIVTPDSTNISAKAGQPAFLQLLSVMGQGGGLHGRRVLSHPARGRRAAS